jgi:DnaK suppressor protein
MEIATQTHLASLRNMLTYRLGELNADLHAADLAAAGAETSAPGVEEVHDTKDAAGQASDLAVLKAQRKRDADELTLVEAALKRLDAGAYGDCAECGEPIPLARLWVQPAAERCAHCQAEVEKAAHAS